LVRCCPLSKRAAGPASRRSRCERRIARGNAAASHPSQGPAQPAKPGVPDDLKLIILIRTALIALNQANLTGNYSVLRDIATPSFQQANNPARAAFVNDQGMLRITGFFYGQWRLFGISVNTIQAKPPAPGD
jgi:hypothetical protein